MLHTYQYSMISSGKMTSWHQ